MTIYRFCNSQSIIANILRNRSKLIAIPSDKQLDRNYFYQRKLGMRSVRNVPSFYDIPWTTSYFPYVLRFLEPDEGENTFDYNQAEIASSVDITSSTKVVLFQLFNYQTAFFLN